MLLREWFLVLKGNARAPKTIEKYRESHHQLAVFLAGGNFPLLADVTAEHLREWLGELRGRGNKPGDSEHALSRRQRLLQMAGDRRRAPGQPARPHRATPGP